MATHEHRAAAERSVGCAVITVSDTRTAATDHGGPAVRDILGTFGHRVLISEIVRDEPAEIRAAVGRALEVEGIDAIITTGGTGIAARDRTVEVVEELISIQLPGFGELFRMLSWESVGPAAMLSRTTAGVIAGKSLSSRDVLIFALPGSVRAVELAMTRLIGPELAHMVWERRKSIESGR